MKRRDFVVENRRGLKLMCTQWHPTFTEDTSRLPCVVYLHGNSSARVDVVKTRALTVRTNAYNGKGRCRRRLWLESPPNPCVVEIPEYVLMLLNVFDVDLPRRF